MAPRPKPGHRTLKTTQRTNETTTQQGAIRTEKAVTKKNAGTSKEEDAISASVVSYTWRARQILDTTPGPRDLEDTSDSGDPIGDQATKAGKTTLGPSRHVSITWTATALSAAVADSLTTPQKQTVARAREQY